MSLQQRISAAVTVHPSRRAVIEGGSGEHLDYAALERLSDRLCGRLQAIGVQRGDRVGIYLRKSADAVASLLGILKAGAAYVPVDPTAPASRNAYIHDNCRVAAVVIERRFEESYRAEMAALGTAPPMIVVDHVGAGAGLAAALDREDAAAPSAPAGVVESADDDLAYILYTSGSTGRPKGVMLSHRNALSFVDWCADTFEPQPDDIFSSHAPFHFDLSILDLYLPLTTGAALVIVPEDTGKDPLGLSRLITRHRISIWYSAPSILSLLAQFGRIGEHDYSSLRMVLFAGEVFPVVHLRSFKDQVPQPRYFNLYGPTETNVCTAHEIPATIPSDRVEPYPIGTTCANLRSRVVNTDGRDVSPGTEGELCIAGPNVLQGYWNLPEQSANCFLHDQPAGERWYRTGDLVVEGPDGAYRYVGRRDRMVKKRGYRVELGEIEACLYRHDAIREAAVVAIPDDTAGLTVMACVSVRNGARPSIIELKTLCAKTLPLYMVPDQFVFFDVLPKTSTDKIDYVALTAGV